MRPLYFTFIGACRTDARRALLGDLFYPHVHIKRARRAFAATGRRATMRNHQGQGQPVPCQELLVPPGFLSSPLFRGTWRISVDYRAGQSGAGTREEEGRKRGRGGEELKRNDEDGEELKTKGQGGNRGKGRGKEEAVVDRRRYFVASLRRKKKKKRKKKGIKKMERGKNKTRAARKKRNARWHDGGNLA